MRQDRQKSLVRTAAALLAAAAFLAPHSADAQRHVARGDSLFRRGRVFAAETLYYYAVRRMPRDPSARLALGRYLAARGALRIGAVLMEEARFFGGNAKTVATYLAPVYTRLGDYKALSTLPGSPLPFAQRSRAEWLAGNAPAVDGPDSSTVPLGAGDAETLGEITLVVGRDTLRVDIDPRVQGLVLDTSWLRRKEVKRFASTYDNDWRNVSGVVLEAGMGEFTLRNTPSSFEATGNARRARIGLDLLGNVAPTFDEMAGTLLIRKSGRVSDRMPGERIPTLIYPGGLFLVRRDGVFPLTGLPARAVIAGRPWTLNARRGELVVTDR